MKLSPFSHWQPYAVLGAALALLGCESASISASEESPPVQTVVAAPSPPDLVSVTDTASEQPAPAQPVPLSGDLQEVVKLAESSVGEEVILAFIQNSPRAFNPSPEQILYLTDLGISDVIITALVNHKGAEVAAAPAAVPPSVEMPTAPPAPPTVPTYNPEPPLVAGYPTEMEPAPAPVVVYEPSPAVEYNYFYSPLAPYGSWVQLTDYGWCWQPTVAVVHTDWRPYCDRGRWLDTDCGWYWQSDYSWGWAPFHYGRWFHHPVRGWCWRPDSAWAPAWVSWRYSGDYCGWAPLPPGAHLHAGGGFSYYGAHVGVSFGFGLGRDAWTFVPAHRMHDREVWQHRLGSAQVANVFHHSRVVNNYAASDHTVVNQGIDRRHVPALARTDVARVAVRDLPDNHGSTVRPDRLHQDGAQLVVYRPKPLQPTLQTGRNSFAESNRAGGSTLRPTMGGGAPASATPTATGRTPGPAKPGFTGARSTAGIDPSRTTGQPSPATGGRIDPRPFNRPDASSSTLISRPAFSTPGAPSGANSSASPGIAARTEPLRSWSAPAAVPQPTPAVRREVPQATIVSPQPSATAPSPTFRTYRTPTGSAAPSWSQPSSGSWNNAFERPSSSPPQAVGSPTPTYRQEAPRITSPGAASPSYGYGQTWRSGTPGSVSTYSTPSQPGFAQPNRGPAYSAPAYSAPSYSAPAAAPRPTYSAPAVQSRPSYSAPAIQSRPSYSAPVQSRPAYTAPAPSRPAPQAAPAPSSGGSSSRRQQ